MNLRRLKDGLKTAQSQLKEVARKWLKEVLNNNPKQLEHKLNMAQRWFKDGLKIAKGYSKNTQRFNAPSQLYFSSYFTTIYFENSTPISSHFSTPLDATSFDIQVSENRPLYLIKEK